MGEDSNKISQDGFQSNISGLHQYQTVQNIPFKMTQSKLNEQTQLVINNNSNLSAGTNQMNFPLQPINNNLHGFVSNQVLYNQQQQHQNEQHREFHQQQYQHFLQQHHQFHVSVNPNIHQTVEIVEDEDLNDEDMMNIEKLNDKILDNNQTVNSKMNLKRTNESLNKSIEGGKDEKQRRVEQQKPVNVAPIIFFNVGSQLLNNKVELQKKIIEMAAKDSVSVKELKVTANANLLIFPSNSLDADKIMQSVNFFPGLKKNRFTKRKQETLFNGKRY